MAKAKLYTLSALSKMAGVSMPTLQRYKKLYQDRIPSVGEGRKQRYPKAAVAEIRKIKEENLKKRGRPRKAAGKAVKPATKKRSAKRASKAKAKAAKPAAKKSGELLTLLEISRRTGISYPTLLRYVKSNLRGIPHEGEGRKRRYYPAAVEVFNEMRAKSPRGRRPKGAVKRQAGKAASDDKALAARIRELEKSQKAVSKQLDAILKHLKRPLRFTVNR